MAQRRLMSGTTTGQGAMKSFCALPQKDDSDRQRWVIRDHLRLAMILPIECPPVAIADAVLTASNVGEPPGDDRPNRRGINLAAGQRSRIAGRRRGRRGPVESTGYRMAPWMAIDRLTG
jgi:hypothetical protein